MSDETNTQTQPLATPVTPKADVQATGNGGGASTGREAAETAKIEAEAAKLNADAEAKKAAAGAYDRAMQISSAFMSPNTWTQIRTMAKVFFEGRALPDCIQNEAQLVMVMQAGYEMGMMPVECLKSLYIVKGTINVYGAAIVRRLREHGWKVEYSEESDASCTARVVRGRESYKETYTFAEAEKSGYTTGSGGLKVGWKPGINRKLKLRYGVLSLIIKSYLPDVLGSARDIAEVAEDAIPLEEVTTVTGSEKPPKVIVATVHGGGGQAIDPKNLAETLAAAQTKTAKPEKKPHAK